MVYPACGTPLAPQTTPQITPPPPPPPPRLPPTGRSNRQHRAYLGDGLLLVEADTGEGRINVHVVDGEAVLDRPLLVLAQHVVRHDLTREVIARQRNGETKGVNTVTDTARSGETHEQQLVIGLPAPIPAPAWHDSWPHLALVVGSVGEGAETVAVAQRPNVVRARLAVVVHRDEAPVVDFHTRRLDMRLVQYCAVV